MSNEIEVFIMFAPGIFKPDFISESEKGGKKNLDI